MKFWNSAELVTLCRESSAEVDVFSSRLDMIKFLSGETPNKPKTTVISSKAKELSEFVTENKYRLNLPCSMVCSQCAAGLILWCWKQLPKTKEMLDAES